MKEQTLAIIKPDAMRAGHLGTILDRLLRERFEIVGMRLVRMTPGEARAFYAVHRGRPFYSSLVEFMSSAPVVVMALVREEAVEHLRRVIGATDPQEAAAGTIRVEYAVSIQENAIHASDSLETAAQEVAFFFSERELLAEWGESGLESGKDLPSLDFA